MVIERWAPFSAFTTLEQEMHSLLDRLGARPWVEGFGWKPDTDIFREDGMLVVQAELPGIDPAEDLSIEVDGNVLQIKGEKSTETETKETDRYVTERRFGSFQRSVMLPDGVDGDEIEANFENGILTVRVPLPERPGAAPTKVHVDVAVGS